MKNRNLAGGYEKQIKETDMVGMLQIITYLLCVYLIFKGVEIMQIALMSTREDWYAGVGMAVGGIAVAASIILAILFSGWITEQAASINEGMQRIPKLSP